MNLQDDPWLLCCLYRMQMEKTLRQNDLFVAFEGLVSKLMVLLANEGVDFFDSNEGVFAKEVIHRLLEEASGYIGDLKQGAFFAAKHHTRALMELYAVTALVDSEIGKKKRFLERFIRFPEIEFYKIYKKHKDSILNLPEEIREEFFYQYGELKDDLLKIFNKKSKDELLEIETWRGNCNIENLLRMLPKNEVHIKNYEKLCLFTHFSSFTRRAETELFPKFTAGDEQMLTVSIKYAMDSYFFLRKEKFFNKTVIKKLDEVFSSIAPILEV